MECLSVGVVRVDGEWGRVVSVGCERSCSWASRLVVKQVALKKVFYVLVAYLYVRIVEFEVSSIWD